MMSMLVFVAVGHIVCGRAAASPPSVPCVLAAMGGWHLALSRAGRRRGMREREKGWGRAARVCRRQVAVGETSGAPPHSTRRWNVARVP